MSARDDERVARTRLRSLKKARAARARNLERARRAREHDRERFAVWIRREHVAFALHVAQPGERGLLDGWRKVLTERPALYGPRLGGET
jgi:hypothetical protein